MSLILLGVMNAQAAGVAGTDYDFLTSTTLPSDASTFTISGIDAFSDYAHLQIVAELNGANTYGNLYFNGVTTGGKYAYVNVGYFSTTLGIQKSYNANTAYLEQVARSSSGDYAALEMFITRPFDTNYYTTLNYQNSNSEYDWQGYGHITFADTTNLSSITFDNASTVGAGSEFRLYGLKA